MLLPSAPSIVPSPDGTAPFGVYRGEIGEVDLGRFARAAGWRPLRRNLSEKRWRYVGVYAQELFLGAAIVRAGYLATSFAFAFERAPRRLTDRESFALPWSMCAVNGLTAGGSAWFRGPGLRVSMTRSFEGRVHLLLRGRQLHVDVVVESAPNPLVLVSPVPHDAAGRVVGVNVTHKAAGLAANGVAEVAGRRFDLTHAYALLDDTCGLLARETRWRWAAAAGRPNPHGPVWGLNLVEGFNDIGATENAVWRDGALHPVGRARFQFDAGHPTTPWRICTDDGAVDLTFAPEGMRAGDVHIGPLVSTYRAPLGTFAGTLLGEPVAQLNGIAESHRARW